MPKIFLSYRHADSADSAGRIHDRLTNVFGKENVFRDIEDIPKGANFAKVLEHEVATSEVMLVIIGKKWLFIKDKAGKRRLEAETDFVRIEVETALRLPQVRVIPVLVNDANMPAEADLPVTLRNLHFCNAAVVRNEPYFGNDIDALVKEIATKNWFRKAKTFFGDLPRVIQILSATILFFVAIASFLFTYIQILPDDQKNRILQDLGIVTLQPSENPKLTALSVSTPDLSTLILNNGVHNSLKNVANDPRGLIVAPTIQGLGVWGYSDAGGGLFALGIESGEPLNIWVPNDKSDPRVYPVALKLDNGRTSALYYDGRWLWVGDSRNKRIIALDPLTLEIMRTYNFGSKGNPVAIVGTGETLWVALQDTGELAALDYDYNTKTVTDHCRVGRLAVGQAPSSLAVQGHTAVWVAYGRDDGAALQIAVQDCRTSEPVAFAMSITSIAVSQNRLWVTAGGKLWSVDLGVSQLPFQVSLPTPLNLRGVISFGSDLWLITSKPDLERLANGVINLILPLNARPGALLNYGVQTWVATEDNVVTRFTVPDVVYSNAVDVIWHNESWWLIDQDRQLCQLETTEICTHLNFDGQPLSLANTTTDNNIIWLGTDTGVIWRLDLIHHQVEKAYSVPGAIQNLVEQSGRYLWVTDRVGMLIAIDLRTGAQSNVLENNFNVRVPSSIAFDGTSLWFGYEDPARLTSMTFDGATLRQNGSDIRLPNRLVDFDTDSQALYTMGSGIIAIVDSETGKLLKTIGTDPTATRLSISDGSLWIINRKNGFIYKMAKP